MKNDRKLQVFFLMHTNSKFSFLDIGLLDDDYNIHMYIYIYVYNFKNQTIHEYRIIKYEI